MGLGFGFEFGLNPIAHRRDPLWNSLGVDGANSLLSYVTRTTQTLGFQIWGGLSLQHPTQVSQRWTTPPPGQV